ncbi:MAG TPA: translocation/assembly module TamB domain-containing protein, partial [Burkholderiaceae bacterium]|nr:translocation/assembly module TamB domain-containing protein [Burkholderiaceae bacterium]
AAAPAAPMQRLAPLGAALRLQTDLTGRLIGAGLPAVRLRLEAQADPEQLALSQLIAEAGSARLDASSQLRRENAGWRLRLDSRLRAFDPLVWWPGSADHPLRRGPHRLDGEAHTDLRLPLREAGAATQGGGLAWLAALRGEARVSLGASLFAGVPLSGQLQLRSSQAEAALGGLPHLIADLQLTAGGSTNAEPSAVTLHADLDPNHAQDHWQLHWSSSDLQALAPWWRLIDPARAPLLAGDTRGQLELDGRWPRLRSRGELQAGEQQPLRWWSRSATAAGGSSAPTAQWRDLQARWDLGNGRNDPLTLDAQARQIGGARPALQRLQLQLEGQTGAHRLTLRAEAERSASPTAAATPGDTANPAAADASVVTRHWTLQALADGALEFDAEAGRLAWSGQIAQAGLSERQSGGGQPPATSATPLLTLAATPLRFSHSSLGNALHIGPTQLTAFDARLRLHEFAWRDASLAGEKLPGDMGTPADAHSLTLRAELEPLNVAPLLARAQPEFGWGGDLQLGGRLDVRATPQRVSADVELQRLRGDLLVQDPDNPAGPQQLGLAGLRLALSARDGRWTLVEQVAGGNLGSLDGEQTVQAAPTDFWPPPEAPIAGHIDLRVAQLGHWGRWLPPGWRLGGRLDTHARIAGRVGAPELSGQLVGQRISVRNVLQGVDWRDAALRVALQGDTARIEQFQVLAGDGRLSATGQIRLGAAPQLSAQITAERFAALQRVDRRIVASGQADLQVDARSSLLRGRLAIDEGRFDFTQRDAPALADDVKVGRALPEAAQAPPPNAARGPQRSQLFDLRIDLGQKLSIAGRGLATRLTGELRLTSPGGKIAVHGDVHAEDGSYTAYGQKMTIDRGSVLFGGAADNPRLDIAASKRDLDDVRVGVTVTGTAQNPRIRLFSEPEMTETDKLSYLLLGRASDGLGRTDLALLQRAAIALITGEDDSPGLIERIGLDQFSVRKDESTTPTGSGAASSTTRDTVVSLGKQLSRRWYLGYERSLNAASGTWQLIYKLAQRFTFRAQTGAENALDLIWTWKWGTPGLTVLPIAGGAVPPAGAAAPASAAETRPVR